ncbi:MMPL family transporter [Demequina sp. B12]|uniref:MMPL family transporter n=1 Tax=Demequina sp. B12 TaxID=2992757 RepID=UPI00237C0AA6|nr:MMPL family transporter [Demequina sp. B12]MDE0572511.1 MMPL family transporter [Demequina sp. B12]
MSTGFTGRIAHTAARRPWLTITAWLIAMAAAIAAASGLDDVLTQDDSVQVATESGDATTLVDEHRPDEGPDTETIVVASADHEFGSPRFTEALAGIRAAIENLDGVGTVSAPTADAPVPVAADLHSALMSVDIEPGDDGTLVEHYLDTLESAAPAGFEVRTVGDASGEVVFDTLAEEGLIRGEAIGIGVALVILVVVFGALAAAGIPILVAIVSIITSIGATAVVGQAFELSFFVVNMITMMGLALGIDYSLVMVQRFREELAAGHEVRDAVTIAGSTANRAVFFSGLTVVISLMGLLLVPSTIMRSLGAGAIVVALMSVAAALTLLPAILALLGHRVNKGRVPTAHPGRESRAWTSIAHAVSRRPVTWAVSGFLLLAILAAPIASMRLAFPGLDSLPEDNDLRIAVDTLREDYGIGQGDTVVAIHDGASYTAEVENLVADMNRDPAFADAHVEYIGPDAIIDATSLYDSADPEASDAIVALRDTTIPQYLGDTDTVAYVGGAQAEQVDFTDIIMDSAPWVLLAVLGISFLLLMVSFRSVVVPVVAIVLNLLSTGAAFGMLVAVFQFGWGASLFGFPQVDGIAPWIPLLLFAVLFGLSMDYHVFLLSRIKEKHDSGAHTRESVAYGLAHTGSLITGAALIMVAVFAGFALSDLAEFAQMGFGLAAAVIIDATVVRSILVPAVMTMLGKHNWYLPGWLQWLPHVTIEAPSPAALASGSGTSASKDEREPVPSLT